MKRTPVKQIPPSTLRTQLAHGQAADPHPDADLLSAFAEHALIDSERANILAHLAACPDCRAILHTATVAEPETTPQFAPLPPRPLIRTWLPGFALAASFLVMVATTVLFYRTLHSTPALPQTATAAPAPQLPAAPPAAPEPPRSAANNAHPAGAMQPAPKHRAAPRPAPSTPSQIEEAQDGATAPPPLPPAVGVSRRETLGDLAQVQNAPTPADDAQLQAELRAQTSYHGAMSKAKAAPPASPSAAQSVEVESSNAFAGSLKTTQPQLRGLIAAPAARPHFRITDTGHLERSTESGGWLAIPIAPDAHFRVVSISGADVWAGGDHLRLFHSPDNGVTWTELQLPANPDRTHAIVHIRIDTPQKFTVEDEMGATFTTTDAGATWQ